MLGAWQKFCAYRRQPRPALGPNIRLGRVTLAILCASVLPFVAPHTAAQGCAMCYQSAAASGAAGRAALRHGILVLLVPAIGLFLGTFALIYRRRNPADR